MLYMLWNLICELAAKVLVGLGYVFYIGGLIPLVPGLYLQHGGYLLLELADRVRGVELHPNNIIEEFPDPPPCWMHVNTPSKDCALCVYHFVEQGTIIVEGSLNGENPHDPSNPST